MYSGFPLIASNTTVHNITLADDLVKYFNAGDPQDLADAIRTICNNKLMRQQLVEKSAKFIQGNIPGLQKGKSILICRDNILKITLHFVTLNTSLQAFEAPHEQRNTEPRAAGCRSPTF